MSNSCSVPSVTKILPQSGSCMAIESVAIIYFVSAMLHLVLRTV